MGEGMRIDFSSEKLWLSNLWADIKATLHKDREYVVVGTSHYSHIVEDDLVSVAAQTEINIKNAIPVIEQFIIKEITSMGFISVMEKVGQDIEKGLEFVLKYSIPIETIVKLLFPELPAVGVATTAAFNVAQLIQNAVVTVEQKYAALNTTGITSAQKLADVIAITEPVVISGLAQAGITADTSYVTSLVNAVVALLNIPTSTTVTVVPTAPVVPITTGSGTAQTGAATV